MPALIGSSSTPPKIIDCSGIAMNAFYQWSKGIKGSPYHQERNSQRNESNYERYVFHDLLA